MVRELAAGEEHLAAEAILELRPHLGDEPAAAASMLRLREGGLRLLGAFVPGREAAVAAAGFRVTELLAHGLHLYVDDLVTLPAHRGAGHARALLEALDAIGAAEGCATLQLDSGVQPERQAAHRRYFAHGMRIASFHFSKEL